LPDGLRKFDWSVGRVVQSLRTKGLLEDTLDLFTGSRCPWFQGSPGCLSRRNS